MSPEIDSIVAASYPTENPTDPYTDEIKAHKQVTHRVRKYYQDGHHPANRWDLTLDQVEPNTISPQLTPHEHDDWKRLPPEIVDQEPEKSRIGFLAQYRVPDSSAVYSQIDGGDQMGYSTEDRAKYGKGVLGPGDNLEFPAKKTKP